MEDTTQKYGSIPLDKLYAIRDDNTIPLKDRVRLINTIVGLAKKDVDKIMRSMTEGYLYCPECDDWIVLHSYMAVAANRIMYDYQDDNVFEWAYFIRCPHGHMQEINKDSFDQIIKEREEYNFQARGIK